MNNIAVINAIDMRPAAFRPLFDGSSAFQRALSFGRRLPGVTDVVLLARPEVEAPAGIRAAVRATWSTAELLSEMDKAAEGHDDVFYFFADCPFLDETVAARMHGNHRRYWADYTFADGFPYGLTPEILRRETAGRLSTMAAGDTRAPDRQTVFTVISKDINSFDIETELAPTDLRLLRVSLSADTERNFLLLKRIVEKGGRESESICRVLQTEARILRTLPAFFPIQIVERCPHACSYCPYPLVGGDILSRNGSLPLESFSALVRKIAAFCGDAVIDISLWGEPSLHPRIFDMIGAVLSEPGLSLVIETSGVGWDPALPGRVHDSFPVQPTWIVSLDAHAEQMYRRLRGEGVSEAMRTADKLLSLFPRSTWVQAVRMRENEEDLDEFYKFWKTKTENIIIQKYDSFSGLLEDRKVADLSPVKRFPCWHLKRDMAILIDGTVPLCREDVRAQSPQGNALTEDLEVIWERAEAAYRQHVAERYPAICAGCDEYYTYNF